MAIARRIQGARLSASPLIRRAVDKAGGVKMRERPDYFNPWVVGAIIVFAVIAALFRGC